MAQPVLSQPEIDFDSNALAAFDERPRPRPVASRPVTAATPRYPGTSSSSRWQRYSDWWAWGAALLAVASAVALFAFV